MNPRPVPKRIALCIAAIFIAFVSSARSHALDDFTLTLERTGCLGKCPDYKVTIHDNGTLRYEGRFYVHVKGIKEKRISEGVIEKLAKKLQQEDFFHWESGGVCLDLPEIRITAALHGVRKEIVEGCDSDGKIAALANDIEKITGIKRWIRGGL